MERKQNRKKVKDDLYIGTYNVRTLEESHHLESLLHKLNLIKWDVIGLAEVRRPGRGMVDVGDGHVLIIVLIQPRGWTRAKGRPHQRWNDDQNWQRYTDDQRCWNLIGKTCSLQLRKAINSTTSTT